MREIQAETITRTVAKLCIEANCHLPQDMKTCICNHILVTRHCRPVGKIKFILVGEDLGF